MTNPPEKRSNGEKKTTEGHRKPRGHEKMVVWQNIDRLDIMVQKILKYIPKNQYKMRSQIDSASDSIGANFVEGYYSGALGEYIRFLYYSKRSLGELKERVRRVRRKGYIEDDVYSDFDDLSIRTMYLLDRLIGSLKNKRILKQKNKRRPAD
ncbi:MAG: four helix bundle protein [candidate division WOR-3 bacterium]|nr:MAG: four helix bundle protein [candidate division WOR-3 bacterium]